jgi:prophage regulatory protein
MRIAQGVFPRPVSLGSRAVGWPSGEIAALNAARIAEKSNSEIIDLVAQLEAARKTAA